MFASLIATPAFGAPQLVVSVSPNSVTLSWQGDGFILESSDGLGNPITWTNAELAITSDGENHSATVASGDAVKFFRLVSSGPPPVPAGLVVVPEESSLFLNWNGVPAAQSYNIYLSTASGISADNYTFWPDGQKITVTSLPYFLTGLINGVKYYFVVTAENVDGESYISPEVEGVFGPHAQVSGSIYVNAHDRNGMTRSVYLPGINVWLSNATNGAMSATVMTDADGRFSFPPQPAGPYRVCYSLFSGFSFCASGCSTQQFVISNKTVSLPPIPITPTCDAVYGRITLNGNPLFQDTDPFLGYDIRASVTIPVSPTPVPDAPITGPAFVNQSGEFVFFGFFPSTSFQIAADCEQAHLQETVSTLPGNDIVLSFTNNPPVIRAAYAMDAVTGKQIHRAAPGSSVLLVVEAEDADGDSLHYQWVPGMENSIFIPLDISVIPWELPPGGGLHTMYFSVRDYKGGIARGKITLSTDPEVFFSGVVNVQGTPPASATVNVNGQPVICNPDGFFSLSVSNPIPPYILNIESPGCETYSRTLQDAAPQADYTLTRFITVTSSTTVPIVVNDFDGDGLADFPANCVVDSSGADFNGTAVFGVSVINLLDPSGRFPGDFSGINSTGGNIVLTPYSAVFVDVRDLQGSQLFIKTTATVFVEAPFASWTPVNPSMFSIWHFDPATGRYIFDSGFTGVTKLDHLRWQINRTGLTTCADSNMPSACITLEIDRSINLPVNVTMYRPAVQPLFVTKRFTTINNLPPNQQVSFVITNANDIALNDSCIISNVVNTGPPNPLALQGSNCVPVKMKFPCVPTPGNMLAFKFGPGLEAYGNAYYKAIDPNDSKPTFDKWLVANGYIVNGTNVPDAEAIYFNNGDLGFGRWMGMKTNVNGDIAYYVSNYKTPDEAIAAKVAGDYRKGLIATVCMEYSAHPGDPTNRYTKFYIYNAQNQRIPGIDLDDNREKFVPHLCLVCHGGEKPEKDMAAIGSGNLSAKFLPFDLESFRYSKNPQFTQAAQAAAFKVLNAYTLKAASTPAIKELVEGWYGGASLPGAYNKDFTPPGWQSDPKKELTYSKAFKISCRACHSARENGAADFRTYDELNMYSGDIYTCGTASTTPDPCERTGAQMPNALRTFNIYWTSRCSEVDQPMILKTNFDLKCP